MSIDYIRKTLETMLYFKKTSISESFSNGGSNSYTVTYLSGIQQFEVKSSDHSELLLFNSVDMTAEWLQAQLSSNMPHLQEN